MSHGVNDPAIVCHEYETEDRFLARRLSTWAELDGPLVEDVTLAAIRGAAPKQVLEVGCGTGDFSGRVQDGRADETTGHRRIGGRHRTVAVRRR